LDFVTIAAGVCRRSRFAESRGQVVEPGSHDIVYVQIAATITADFYESGLQSG